MPNSKGNCGSILITILVFTSVFSIFLIGLVSLVLSQQRLVDRKIASDKALQIAEAGINYYRWHLAHAINDYADGTGQTCDPCGPYTHTYSDPWGGVIGQYKIKVTPPPTGSDIVTVESTGWLNLFPNRKRKVAVQFRRPSLVKYVVIANDAMRFGADTDVYGEVHSNGGIRFDGVAHNIISSSRTTYIDPDSTGLCTIDSQNHNKCPGVWTSQTDPNTVFLAGIDFPVPVIDFSGMTTDLNKLKTLASNNGVKQNNYLWIGDGIYLGPSSKQGYLLQFKVVNNITKVDIFRVKSQTNSCNSQGTYGVSSTDEVATNLVMPNNGIIFVEDNAWVEGQVYNTGLAVATARFPDTTDTNKNIYINNDLVYYGDYDTSKLNTTIGLIAQKNISVGLFSEDDLEIDAALLAQKGRIGRNYYSGDSCDNTYYKRNSITIKGALATYGRYGFSWTNSQTGKWSSGYHYRNLIFNDQLRASPPPSYPVAGEYTFLSWKEMPTANE